MYFYTVATTKAGYFNTLMESCKRHGINMTVLGMGQKWAGFIWKWKLVSQALVSARHIRDDEFVGVVDAYDLIFVRDTNAILTAIRAAKAENKVIVASDGFDKSYYFGSCHGKRVNAGTIIAKKRVMLNFINSMCNRTGGIEQCPHAGDDQVLFTTYCKTHKDIIHVDVGYHISFTYYPRKIRENIYEVDVNSFGELVVKAEKRAKRYNRGRVPITKPCILHAPRNGDMNKLLNALGYTNVRKRDSFDWLKTMVLHWIMQPHVYVPFALVAISIIVVLIMYHTRDKKTMSREEKMLE